MYKLLESVLAKCLLCSLPLELFASVVPSIPYTLKSWQLSRLRTKLADQIPFRLAISVIMSFYETAQFDCLYHYRGRHTTNATKGHQTLVQRAVQSKGLDTPDYYGSV